MADPRIQYLVQRARALGLDPEAVLAIDSHEGLSGGIGDGGHAFGPGQMNNAGGVLTGKFQGMTPQQINTWAWSKPGLDYYLNGVAKVARGLKGRAAVEAIASRYERPADIPGEIRDAMAHYGKMGAGRMTPNGVTPPMTPNGGNVLNAGGSASRQQLAALLLGGAGRTDFGSNQIQPPNLIALAQMRQQLGGVGANGSVVTAPQGSRVTSPIPTSVEHSSTGVHFEGDASHVDQHFLAQVGHAAQAAGATRVRITSGYRSPEHNAAVGGVGHSNHLTGHALDGEAFIPGKGWVPLGAALLPVVGKFGLRSGDVPGFFNGNPDPVHVDDGFNHGR